jgi:hypothetical protein
MLETLASGPETAGELAALLPIARPGAADPSRHVPQLLTGQIRVKAAPQLLRSAAIPTHGRG